MEAQESGTKYVDEFIASLKLGEPDSYANLAVFPVFSDKAGEDGYRTLDEAIKTRKFMVTEVSDGGHVNSQTEAMSDIYESYDKDLKGYEGAFKPRPGQVGFIALIDGKVVGFDIFGIRSILPKVYAKLLRGYILDALDKRMARRAEREPEQAEKEAVADVKKFLLKVKRAKRETFKAVGEGSDVRFKSKTVDGFALADGQVVIHMAAFAE